MELRDILDRRDVPPFLRLVAGRLLDLVERARDRLQAIDDRLDQAQQVAVRIRIVDTVGELPANADVTEFFRVKGDPAVYVGNGPTAQLRKIPTQPL